MRHATTDARMAPVPSSGRGPVAVALAFPLPTPPTAHCLRSLPIPSFPSITIAPAHAVRALHSPSRILTPFPSSFLSPLSRCPPSAAVWQFATRLLLLWLRLPSLVHTFNAIFTSISQCSQKQKGPPSAFHLRSSLLFSLCSKKETASILVSSLKVDCWLNCCVEA